MKTSNIVFLALVGLAASKNVFTGFNIIEEIDKRDAEPKNVFKGLQLVSPDLLDKRHINEEQQPLKEDEESAFTILPIDMPDHIELPNGGPTLLTTQLTQINSISIFASYIRDDVDINNRVDNNSKSTIVFAPTNDALMALNAKPWEFPNKIDDAVSDEENDKLIRSNLNTFIKSHLVNNDKDGLSFEKLKDSNGVELKSQTGAVIKLKAENDNFFVFASDSWVAVEDVKVVDNGVILTVGRCLVSA